MKNILRPIAIIISALALLTAPSSVMAQDVESYKFDIGGGIGFSGYLGDANESNLLKHPGVAANIEGRYLFDPRWAVRAQLTYASISGNTTDFDNKLPYGNNYKFKASLLDLGVRGEVNFFAFGIGETYKRLRRWSPYLSLGLGVTMSFCGESKTAALSLPMGVGVRYKLRPRINLSAEFTMTKTFGDHMDGKDLSDLYQIKSSFIKNTDWYSTFMVGISFEFGPRCTTCQRKD